MNKNKSTIVIFLIFLFLNSCGSVAEGLGNSKKKGSDEFLVEKKAPLILPPKFGILPEPETKMNGNEVSTKNNDNSSIEKIINQSSSLETSKENNDLNVSIEKSIIEKINEQ